MVKLIRDNNGKHTIETKGNVIDIMVETCGLIEDLSGLLFANCPPHIKDNVVASFKTTMEYAIDKGIK